MKGQMEIFGLVIITFLIILAFLLFLRFSGGDEAIAGNFFQQQMPTKSLQTLLSTTTNCKDQDVRVLLTDVGNHLTDTSSSCNPLSFQSNSLQVECAVGRSSYDELFRDDGITGHGVVNATLRHGLERLRIPFEFTAVMEDGCQLYHQEFEGCSKAKNINAQRFSLPTQRGVLFLLLRTC